MLYNVVSLSAMRKIKTYFNYIILKVCPLVHYNPNTSIASQIVSCVPLYTQDATYLACYSVWAFVSSRLNDYDIYVSITCTLAIT